MEWQRRLLERVEAYREDMTRFQSDLTAVTALGPENGGDGEAERASWLEERLRCFGIRDVERRDAPDGRVSAGYRPNLIARVPAGRHSAGDCRTIWVLTHLDTVPPGDLGLWKGDPWSVRVEEGMLIGRGVEDNQQGLTASVFAARAVLEERIELPCGLGLFFVADEETGNAYGVDHVLDDDPELVTSDDLVVVPDFGSGAGDLIEVAEKSVLWCRVAVTGQQVHASTPDAGRNAHRAAAHLAVRLDQVLPAEFPAEDELFTPARSTFEPTKREANVPNVNTIPGRDGFYLDCRVLPRYPLAEVREAIAETARSVATEFGVEIAVDYPTALPAAPATPPDAPVVKALSEAIAAAAGVEARPGGIGGGTVAAAFRSRGIPAAVWATMDGTAHQPNEYCVVDNLVNDAKVFALLFSGACGR